MRAGHYAGAKLAPAGRTTFSADHQTNGWALVIFVVSVLAYCWIPGSLVTTLR